MSSKIDRKGAPDPILLHPKRWNLRFFVDRGCAGETAQILAIQGEFALRMSWVERS